MTIQKVETGQAPEALGHYEQGIVANGFVFTAMQLPIDPANPAAAPADIEGQTEQVLKNVIAIVESAGSTKEKIVQLRIYLTDIKHWESANAVYEKVMGPSAKPARAVVMVAGLHKGYGIAVEATAVI